MVSEAKRVRTGKDGDFSLLPSSRFTPTIEQAIKLIDKWLEFKYSQTCPNDKTKTIKEVLEEVEKQNIIEENWCNLQNKYDINSMNLE